MVARDFSRHFDPAYSSNGLIGIRPGPNPLAQAAAALSGFVYAHLPYQMQALSPAPYPLMMDVVAGDVSLLGRPDLLQIHRQALDMATGELSTRMTFSPRTSARFQHEILQFASRSVPALMCQEVRITPSANVQALLASQIGTKGVPGTVYRQYPPPQTKIDLVIGIRSHGGLSKMGAAVMMLPGPGITRAGEPFATVERLIRRYEFHGRAGETIRFQTIAAMVSEFYHPEPELEAIRMARWGATLGFDFLRKENRARWAELWKSRVKISGDAESQKVLDASFFYLHSSLSPSDKTGMAPFGLSQTGAYYGLSSWDTESWSLIPVMLASPATAKSLLEFRRRSLGHAKKLAALYGYRGAQFPWEAAPVDGFESTPTFAATGWEEQPSTPDVALGFWECQVADGDEGFLRQATWPVLKALAQWIVSRGVYTRRGLEIHHIMGPDEGSPDVNNDAYVNVITKTVLQDAGQCEQKVGEVAPASWQRAARRLFVPMDSSKNIVLPCDHPPEGKNYPIGGLDMLTVHAPPVSKALLRRTFNFEETLRARRAPSIGFATAAAAATAAYLGYRKQAQSMSRTAWAADGMEPVGMLKEAPVETYGCFLTNCGSLLQTVMLSFTGLRIREGDWRAYPANLPEGWSKIEIDQVWVKGNPRALVAESGKLVRWME